MSSKRTPLDLPEKRIAIPEYFKERAAIVAEDRPAMRKAVRAMLRSFGIPNENIHEAGDGLETLALLQKCDKGCLLLLDLHMPRLSGLQVLRRMAKSRRLKDTPVIVITADNHESQVGLVFEEGASAYIIKPFTEETLREKIGNLINPSRLLKKFAEVENLILHGEYEKAIKMTEQILRVKKGSPGAYVLRGEAYEGLQRDRLALASYEKAHSHAPIFLRVIRKLYEYHLKRGQLPEGLFFLKKADRLNPYHFERKMEIGKIHLQVDQPSEAEKAFDQALHLNPDAVLEIAELCLEKFPALAEKYFREALAIKKDVHTINRLAIALRTQGKWQDAVREYETALRISPSHDGLFFNIGRAYSDGGLDHIAVSYFKRALEANPDLAEAEAEIERLTKAGNK